jgi:hypothetical protein
MMDRSIELLLLRLLGALAILLLFYSAAFGAEPSRCSPPAGTRAMLAAQAGFTDHQAIVCTATSCARSYVGSDGFLRACNPWVPDGGDPLMPRPPEPCPARTTYERWGGDGDMCDSAAAGYAGAYGMLPATASGRAWLITDEWGNSRGVQLWRCTEGRWTVDVERCAYINPPAPEPKPRRYRRTMP